MKKILCTCLTLSVLLAGCANKGKPLDEVKEIVEDYFFTVFLNEDNSLTMTNWQIWMTINFDDNNEINRIFFIEDISDSDATSGTVYCKSPCERIESYKDSDEEATKVYNDLLDELDLIEKDILNYASDFISNN